MKLDEAKEILKKAGYLVRSLNEDTETQDDAHNETVRELHAKYTPEKGFSKSLKQKKWSLERQHLDLDDKIRNAKRFNAKDIESIDDIIK